MDTDKHRWEMRGDTNFTNVHELGREQRKMREGNGVALGWNYVYGGGMKTPLLRFGATLLLAILSLGGLQAAEDYAIRLVPVEKPGSKYGIIGSVHEVKKLVILVEGKLAKQETMDEVRNFEADVEVAQVNGYGVATKLSVRVKKYTVTSAGETREALPKGSVITASVKEGKKVYLVNEQEAEVSVARALKEFITLYDAKGPKDDTVFGTQERKKVGDVWPIHGEMALKELAGKQMEVRAEDLSGEAKLEGVVEVDGQKCLKISGKTAVKKLTMPMPGFQVQKGTVEAVITGVYQVKDNRRMAATMGQKMEIRATGAAPDGRAIELTMETSIKGEKKFKHE